MVMSPVHQVWPKLSCEAQWKGEEDKAARGRGGKTTSGNGQAWSLPSPTGQWRTGKKRRKLVVKLPVVPQWPSRWRNRWWWWCKFPAGNTRPPCLDKPTTPQKQCYAVLPVQAMNSQINLGWLRTASFTLTMMSDQQWSLVLVFSGDNISGTVPRLNQTLSSTDCRFLLPHFTFPCVSHVLITFWCVSVIVYRTNQVLNRHLFSEKT